MVLLGIALGYERAIGEILSVALSRPLVYFLQIETKQSADFVHWETTAHAVTALSDSLSPHNANSGTR